MQRPLFDNEDLLGPGPKDGATYRYARAILHKATGRIAGYDYTLNPYIGCQFGCSYCYAAFFTPEPEKFDTWGDWVEVKANAADLLRANPKIRGSKIAIGTATDPYQPVELRTRLTRSILEVLAEADPPPTVMIITRSPYVTRDIDVLLRMPAVRIHMSITTDCDEVRRAFEPSCASIDRRFEALAELKSVGVPFGINLAPLLPIRDPLAFAARIRELRPVRVFTQPFLKSKGAFASNTRPAALELAREMGWDLAAMRAAIAVLKEHVPMLTMRDGAFD